VEQIEELIGFNELEYLTTYFRLTTKEVFDQKGSIPTSDLLDNQKCVSFLGEVTPIFNAPSRMVTASQFSKRYSFLTIVPSLYAMTMYNKGLDLSIENSHVESVYQNGNWLPHVRLTDLNVTQPEKPNRHLWRDDVLSTILAGNLIKVWRAVSEAASVPIMILWENTAIYVFWLYEKRMAEGADESQKLRIQEDFQYLIEAPASLYGENENHLGKHYHSNYNPSYSDQPVSIRKTCCLYYQVSSNGSYCTGCPKLNHCNS
jgi:ferric iron reductase protein FhuF